MNFSALILAGGKSSRMGCDKAWLDVDGQPLIERQLALVRELGAAEVFISAQPGTDYSALGCPVLADEFPNAGPLAGIERGLAASHSPLLLVLAVDLPRMKIGFLRKLGAACGAMEGAVPEIGGQLEPLAAFLPKETHALAVQQLQVGRNAVHAFAAVCEARGLLQRYPVIPADLPLLLNWNAPGDFPADGPRGEQARISRVGAKTECQSAIEALVGPIPITCVHMPRRRS